MGGADQDSAQDGTTPAEEEEERVRDQYHKLMAKMYF